jgi:hypothetical protein
VENNFLGHQKYKWEPEGLQAWPESGSRKLVMNGSGLGAMDKQV